MTTRRVGVLTLVIVCLGAVVLAQGPADVPLASWPAPPYWLPSGAIPAAGTPAAEGPEVAAEQAVVRALPLVAIAPCRLLDTRAAGLPALSAGAAQEIAVVGRCGIPAQAQGVSLRLVVGEGTGGGVLTVGAAGEAGGHGGRLVLDRGQGSSTTGVVGLDGSGRLVAVTEGGSLQLVVEVNGYYAGEPAVRSLNALAGDVLLRAGENIAITSEGSTVTIALAPGGSPGAQPPGEVGPPIPGSPPQGPRVVRVLPSPPAKARPPEQAMVPPPSSMYVAGAIELPFTTAVGAGVLTLGGNRFLHNYGPAADAGNTFVGQQAGNFTMGGLNSYEGKHNTAVGYQSLTSNTTGFYNTASGSWSLLSNTTGFYNTASGYGSLVSNTTGFYNTASGAFSLQSNTTGTLNTASGYGSLTNNTTGSYNIALGSNAGVNLTTGNYNIDIGNQGVAAEGATIRIGDSNQTRTFIAGIRGVTTGSQNAIAVLIDSNGQLGTASSSRRFKKDIRDIGEASSRLLDLRPVSFRYIGQSEGVHFGLIAEEVAEVLPELVVHDASGQVETVAYHEMPAMLLNELQKQHATIQAQQAQIEAQREELAAQRAQNDAQQARIDRLERQLEALVATRQPAVATRTEQPRAAAAGEPTHLAVESRAAEPSSIRFPWPPGSSAARRGRAFAQADVGGETP
jgi:polyhydroxyalkanoate synthesis regulator phasin